MKRLSILLIVSSFSYIVKGQQQVTYEQNVPTENSLPNTATTYPKLKNYGVTKYNFVRNHVYDQGSTQHNPSLYYRTSTTYIDGLGRKLQTVTKQGHSEGYDIVQPFLYDSIGRSPYEYLPYAADINKSTGKFHREVLNEMREFYNDSNRNEMPFLKREFENSYTNTILQEAGPGKEWLLTEDPLSGKNINAVKNVVYAYSDSIRITKGNGFMMYFKNMFNVLPKFVINDNAPLGTIPQLQGSHKNNSLVCQATIGAGDRSKTVSYTDHFGNQVAIAQYFPTDTSSGLTSVDYASVEDYIYTIYVYDNFNRLRCVLPPEAIKVSHSGAGNVAYTWTPINGTILNELCYQYEYDDRNRLIKKKLPGKEVEYFIYDKRDRLILTQDGNLRSQNKWLVTLYDKYDRAIGSGIFSTVDNRDVVINKLNQAHTNPTQYNGQVYNYLANYNLYNSNISSIANFELLSQNVYDEYSDSNNLSFDNNYFQNISYPVYVVSPNQSPILTGKLTEQRIRNLDHQAGGLSEWTQKKNFYNLQNQLLQEVVQNPFGGVDYNSNIYYFNGGIWKNIQKSNYPNSQPLASATDVIDTLRIEHTYETNLGTGGSGNAQVWQVKQKINQNAVVNLLEYSYDHLGREVIKNAPTLAIMKSYNVKGFLTGIEAQNVNNTNGFRHIFSEVLSYTSGFAQQLYDGNISGIKWKKSGDATPWESYGYTYDPLNRLLHAEYRKQESNNWSKANVDYSEKNLSYDLNGNIKSLTRRGNLPGQSSPITIDSLIYTNQYNQLTKVTDHINSSITGNFLPDFKDGSNVNVEYGYDLNGNLIYDKNKEIDSIRYNIFNKPVYVKKADGRNIKYYYDGTGGLLKKQITDNNSSGTLITKSYAYHNSGVYLNDTLQYLTHTDGRIRPVVNASNTTSMAYDYYVHDHLGNIRTVVSTQEPITSNYLAEHELVSANIEESIFDNIGSTRSGNPLRDIENMYASRLNAEEEERTVGTSLLLKVMPGDGFSIRAEAFYNSDNDSGNIDNQDLVDRLFNTLLNQGTQQGNPVGESGQSMELLGSLMGQNQLNDALNNIPIDNEEQDAPQAYLNILFLTEDLSIQTDKSKRIQVTSQSKEDWQAVKCQGCLTERIGVTVDEGGYLLIFVSNNSIGKDVWFDNISIQHERGYVLEENHYYPFGLTISSAAAGGVPNKYKFGGKELEQSFGLELYDFHARQYDPQLGRFTSVDPLADHPQQIGISPYAAMNNNPILYVDPDGQLPILPILWAAYEVGSAIYDGYQAYKTVSDKNASRGEKVAAVGGVLLSAALPGGGYGTAAKSTVKAVDKAIDAKKVVKNADAIAEGRKFEADQLAKSVSEGKNVTGRNRLVPQNGKGNVKGNRTDTDQLIKNNDGTFSIKETKRSSSTQQSKGQKATQRHVESGNGIFEVRTNQPSQGLRKGDKIQVKNYERINKHD